MDSKQIPLWKTHEALGARMMPFAGFNMPVRYSSGVDEHITVREKVGIFDVSHMGEFLIRGPQALALIQMTTTNDAGKLAVGQAQYSCLPNQQGGIVDDLLVYRLQEEVYMLVVNAANISKDWDWLQHHNTMGAIMEDRSDHTCLFAVQGPLASEVLQHLTDVDLDALRYYTFTIGTIAGVHDIIISATGYTGSGGFELYLPPDHAGEVWDRIMESGEAYGIKPIGLGARDTLRLEKGYCLYGNDINDTTTPLEAGLGWITKFSKPFIGDDLLKNQKESGLIRKLVGFLMIDRGIPRQGYPIKNSTGMVIGEVTSGTQSPTLDQGIGMGYVSITSASPENEIFIEIRDKLVKAIIKKLPLI